MSNRIRQALTSVRTEEYYVLGTNPGGKYLEVHIDELTPVTEAARTFSNERAASSYLHLSVRKDLVPKLRVIRVLSTVRESTHG